MLIVDYEEGLQVEEIFYGLYYLAFLLHWYITRLFFYKDSILETASEKALALFLVLMTLSGLVGLLFDAEPGAALAEWISLSMFAFYFPVKEACTRYRRGIQVVIAVIIWIGLFVAIRNLLNYQEVLLGATQAWQVAKGRVNANDILLMVSSLVTLVLLILAERTRTNLLLLALFLFFFGSLVLTQSRGYWLAFALGALVLFAFVEGRYRKRLFMLGTIGVLGVVPLGLLLLDDYFMLVLGGLLDRFASLQSATTNDISLVNRFLESRTAWTWIERNPILGYGLGARFQYFDLIYQHTRDTTFIHNGYLALWFKFGLWGVVLVMFFWLGTVWRGLQAVKSARVASWPRRAALGATICLVALMLSALTSNPFHQNDPPFIIALLTGLIAGSDRLMRDRSFRTDDSSPPET